MDKETVREALSTSGLTAQGRVYSLPLSLKD